MPLTGGGEFVFETVHVPKMLSMLVESSPYIARTYEEAVQRHPPGVDTPWHLVVGFDEFIPGNKLSVEHNRKTMVVSCTFTELGQSAMSDELMWTTMCVIRSDVIKRVSWRTKSPTMARS